MVLCELISYLEKEDPNKIVAKGFDFPHSYRGSYQELAFEPVDNVKAGDMLECAQKAVGNTYRGYKGGDYKMQGYTTVHIANHGECGEEIGNILLGYMMGKFDKKKEKLCLQTKN